jgi:hypothetical protein
MTTREYCELRFRTSRNRTRSIRIAEPGAAVGESTVRNAAAQIITANPFDETVGELSELTRADRIIVTRIPILP